MKTPFSILHLKSNKSLSFFFVYLSPKSHDMKTPFLSIAVITLSALTLFSCKKDKETTGESSGPILKTFALKVDDTSLQTEFYSSQHTAGMLIIQTNINGGLIFGLALGDSLQIGTYPMGPGLSARLTHTDDNYATSYISDPGTLTIDRKSTRLNSSHSQISYAVFCLKK